ncbi:MarR family transcriptional regulator [bacterium]|nr:MarR family transcriptional regulator [bacterium]
MGKSLFDLVQDVKRVCIFTEDRIRKEFDLSYVEFMAMHLLNPEEKLTGSEFSERMQFSTARGSRVVNQLLTKGLVDTTVLPNNRRSMEIVLSKYGCKLKKKIDDEIKECESRILDSLKPDARKSLKMSLEILSGLLIETQKK